MYYDKKDRNNCGLLLEKVEKFRVYFCFCKTESFYYITTYIRISLLLNIFVKCTYICICFPIKILIINSDKLMCSILAVFLLKNTILGYRMAKDI